MVKLLKVYFRNLAVHRPGLSGFSSDFQRPSRRQAGKASLGLKFTVTFGLFQSHPSGKSMTDFQLSASLSMYFTFTLHETVN
jgi:hypothetical protein